MTKHNFRLLDIYTDYLLSSFGATTATGLSRLLPDLSHDQVTRFLSQQPLGDRDLWRIVKPHVRAIESPEAVLIIDDTVQEKQYTDESELITWHYDHSKGRTVKGINLLSALYLSREVSLPVAFELIQKTVLTTDPKTGRDPGALWAAVSPHTKNELARSMIARVKQKQVAFAYVLADVWFSSAQNMVFIKQEARKEFILPLKKNRRVALSESDRNHGRWTTLSALDFTTQNGQSARTLYLESVPFPVVVSRQVFINEDGSEGVLFLCSSEVSLSGSALWMIYQKRWKVEEYHKSLKSNAALAKSPTKLPNTQQNHIFSSLVAFIKLESYRIVTHLNHFALKAKLYQGAIQAAFGQLQILKDNYPQLAITT